VFLPDGAARSRPRSPAARTMRMPSGRKRRTRWTNRSCMANT